MLFLFNFIEITTVNIAYSSKQLISWDIFTQLIMYNRQMSGKTKKKKKSDNSNTIALNKKARFDYFIEETYEAGLALQGWEVKSLRAKSVQIRDTYIMLKNGEAWLLGCVINPLPTVSTHFTPDKTRIRKLLLHRHEIDKLIGAVERKGYAIVATAMYWKKGKVKLEIGTAKGKKTFDKRQTEKDRDWKRDKARIMKTG